MKPISIRSMASLDHGVISQLNFQLLHLMTRAKLFPSQSLKVFLRHTYNGFSTSCVDLRVPPCTTPTVVVFNDIPNITPDVVIEGIAVLIPTIPLASTLAAYLGYNSRKLILQLLCNDGGEFRDSSNTIIHLTILTTYLATSTIIPTITLITITISSPTTTSTNSSTSSPPRDVATGRPALQVVILGEIIYTRENIGNIR
ncbi:hypothetical protein Tco_1069733 [Tanacetum coccineum]|uniref:Uncharacterized protein n=1 Tax=Tanacetum coccineum TaxID=301880 RepID=A0ABQ5HKV6_9ASTR